MTTEPDLQIVDGYASYRPVGQVSLQQAVDLVSATIAWSRRRQIRRLFVDTTGLTGFDPPDLLERFLLAEKLADAAQGSVKLALLLRPEMMRDGEFGLLVARNRGLIGNHFLTEAEALTWLLDRSAA